MGFEIDPVFQNSSRQARTRQRRRMGVRIGLGVCACVVLGLAGWGIVSWLRMPGDPMPADVAADQAGGEDRTTEDDITLVQSEDTARAAIEIERLNSFIDLRRDPMILRFASAEASNLKELAAPEGFARGRLSHAGQGAITALKDALFVAERGLVTTLPSSRNDFALFKAQRSQALQIDEASGGATPVAAGQLVQVREESSWGSFISSDADEETSGDTSADDAAIYVETRIENTTSVAVTLRESQRKPLFEDKIRVLRAKRAMGDVLIANGIPDAEAEAIVRAAGQKLNLGTQLEEGSILALRLRPEGAAGTRLMLMSVYGPQGYLASLAQVGAGRFEPAADPWIGDDLLSRSDQIRRDTQSPGDIRLLDAFYSAAIRNGMPTKLVGELIVAMSQGHDLDRFTVEGDEIVILQATAPGAAGGGLGRVLYAGIHSSTEKMSCYVLAKADNSGFSCFDFNAPAVTGGTGAGGLGGGLLVPVNGVKTSGFGPRHHPILKQVRNHNGIDWAAPTGTPIQAAAAGVIKVAGDGGGYGNVIYIDHGRGLETRYAHMNAFAKGMRKGSKVAAGEVIGYVGTTGRSTGPHLHFELRLHGKPVNPLSFAGTGGGAGAGSQAVEALVNQIIKVESAGNANAKNPLSTATGLGQFIESTWLRMMRDYRPELAKSMSRAQLLALRTDPAMSRDMVRNLARENEAFLRARGHQITAGRLYLAHFLGPAGADKALRANTGATVLSVMGAAVVNANPFLRGKSIADLRNWADRKMRGAKSGSGTVVTAAPQPKVIPAKVKAFKEEVDQLLAKL